jgi:hypothetical protein
VHTNIHANEGVPSDIRFTSAATNDSFMLKPANYNGGEIIAMDRAYIDYSKFEELTERGVIYVTKMKKNLVYEELSRLATMGTRQIPFQDAHKALGLVNRHIDHVHL